MPGGGAGGGAGWLIIGFGNADRGDDGAGIEVSRCLAGSGLAAVVHQGDALGLIELWREARRVIVIDAVVGATAPAGYARFNTSLQPLPAPVTTAPRHGIGLAETIEIARALSLLPDVLVVYAIGAQTFALGSGLAPAVAAACAEVADRIRREVAATAAT